MTYEDFCGRFQIRLDSQQEEAVQQTRGPVLLLAVPGSGKTTVLVARLGYLIYGIGIDPARILTVTYTVAATREMKERFQALFGPEYADKLAFRTINGICSGIIQAYAQRYKRTPFTLVSREAELAAILRMQMAQCGVEHPSEQQIKEIRTAITYTKNSMLSQTELMELKVEGVDFSAFYDRYQRYMREHRRMDFDDQMVIAYRILQRHPDILDLFQTRYPYLCVDEAQDTSKIQHAILRLLASRSHNLFMVGDEDQSIYGFRAAWPQALLEFEQVYPEAKVLLMETNYRSEALIVERADALIQRNQSRHPKHMRPARSEPGKLQAVNLSDYSRQYAYLAEVAEHCTERTAVLYRNNDSALPLINLLEQRGIPYTCRQRESAFFTSPAVRDVSEILSFAWEPCNAERFLAFYLKLDLKLKRALVAGALRKKPSDVPVLEALLASGAFEGWQIGKIKALQTHFSKLPSLTSYAAVQRIIKYMGYGDSVQKRGGDTARFDVLLALAAQTQNPQRFLEQLEILRNVVERQEPDPDCLFQLSTIHASKGLEYERVILMDVMDGLFPSVDLTAGRSALSEEEQKLLEEERRLFYVGVTRARKRLDLLTYERRFGEEAPRSMFVDELLGSSRCETGSPTGGKEHLRVQSDYPPGTALVHRFFGPGTLLSCQGAIASIQFRSGVKKIDLAACLRKELIHCPETGKK